MEIEGLRLFEFTAPSGYKYTIREENGADEEVISNQAAVKTGDNINNFIQGIVVSTDFCESGKLSREDVLDLPVLDRYAILLNSRIFSLGNILEFTYSWPNELNPTYYEQDLNDLLFEDYNSISKVEEEKKPFAIPKYSDSELLRSIRFKNYEVVLSTGKKVKFDFLTGRSEKEAFNLPDSAQTRNADLLLRNLSLFVNNKWDRVQEFSLFSRKEMAELRKVISTLDPIWNGMTDITNPKTNEVAYVSVFSQPRFFYPTEA